VEICLVFKNTSLILIGTRKRFENYELRKREELD
jgi:hypothetical protein